MQSIEANLFISNIFGTGHLRAMKLLFLNPVWKLSRLCHRLDGCNFQRIEIFLRNFAWIQTSIVIFCCNIAFSFGAKNTFRRSFSLKRTKLKFITQWFQTVRINCFSSVSEDDGLCFVRPDSELALFNVTYLWDENIYTSHFMSHATEVSLISKAPLGKCAKLPTLNFK